ncbi:hypothetical protein CY35_05G016800, partial [Sphagnum magellanicum]
MSSLESKNTNVMQEVPYSMVVGCLMHVMTHPCPNLAYHVSQVAMYMENACQAHWFGVKLIIRLTSSHIYTLADGVISWQNKQK